MKVSELMKSVVYEQNNGYFRDTEYRVLTTIGKLDISTSREVAVLGGGSEASEQQKETERQYTEQSIRSLLYDEVKREIEMTISSLLCSIHDPAQRQVLYQAQDKIGQKMQNLLKIS